MRHTDRTIQGIALSVEVADALLASESHPFFATPYATFHRGVNNVRRFEVEELGNPEGKVEIILGYDAS